MEYGNLCKLSLRLIGRMVLAWIDSDLGHVFTPVGIHSLELFLM